MIKAEQKLIFQKLHKLDKHLYEIDLTNDEIREIIQNVKKNRNELEQEISLIIQEIIKIIKMSNPFLILQYIALKNTISDLNNYCESTETTSEAYVEYTQSLITSIDDFQWENSPSNEDLKLIDELLSTLFLYTTWYWGTETKSNETEEDYNISKLRFLTLNRYIYERGDSYEQHENEMIIELFSHHSNFFEEHYNLTFSEIMESYKNIGKSLQANFDNLFEHFNFISQKHKFFKDWISSKGDNENFVDSMKEFRELPQTKDIDDNLRAYKISDFPFNISPNENISVLFLEQLSLELGENEEFTKFSSYWVTNNSMIYEKPLIKKDNNYYCFYFNILGRNFKHILQEMIRKKNEKYYLEHYLKRTRDLYLEKKTAQYFQNIFPHATFYPNMKYAIGKQEYETDLIIAYDRFLLIIECKAGAIPQSALRGSILKIKSITNKILQESYNQLVRVKQYLDNNTNANFHTHSCESFSINQNNYDEIFLLNVTLERLDFVASENQNLSSLGFNFKNYSFWSIFINDLKVISEINEFSSQFLLYMQRRFEMMSNPLVSSDELDYYMLFLQQGLFFPDENRKKIRLATYGFTDILDRYYFYKQGLLKEAEKPEFQISDDLKQLIIAFENSTLEYNSVISLMILNHDGKIRNNIISNLFKIISLSNKNNKNYNFSIPLEAVNAGLTFVTNIDTVSRYSILESIEYCQMLIELHFVEKWFVVILSPDDFVKIDKIKKISKNFHNRDKILAKLENYRKDKINSFLFKYKKIPRNILCPCGSNIKYKKCCLQRDFK